MLFPVHYLCYYPYIIYFIIHTLFLLLSVHYLCYYPYTFYFIIRILFMLLSVQIIILLSIHSSFYYLYIFLCYLYTFYVLLSGPFDLRIRTFIGLIYLGFVQWRASGMPGLLKCWVKKQIIFLMLFKVVNLHCFFYVNFLPSR